MTLELFQGQLALFLSISLHKQLKFEGINLITQMKLVFNESKCIFKIILNQNKRG